MYSRTQRDNSYLDRLLNFIHQEYGILSTGITPAKRGFYGETWKIESARESYFVKVDYSTAHKSLYEQSFSVIQYLHQHGIEFISRVVKTGDGSLFTHFNRAVLGIFHWIEGENIENEWTTFQEYKLLAKIYTVPTTGIQIASEDFSTKSAELFYVQWARLKKEQKRNNPTRTIALLNSNSEKLAHRAEKLNLFAEQCRPDQSHFYITHGDPGGNIIVNGLDCYLVDWDAPLLAPPERDAWFSLNFDWAIAAFNEQLKQNGIAYTLRLERMAYYCYHSFFTYLTEYLEAYLDIGDCIGNFAETLSEYFESWIEAKIKYLDGMG